MLTFRKLLLGTYVFLYQVIHIQGGFAATPSIGLEGGRGGYFLKTPPTYEKAARIPTRVVSSTDLQQRFFKTTSRVTVPPDASSPRLGTVHLQVLGGAPVDYSDAARVLFSNLIGPAAMLSSAIVPLGFLGPPMPRDKPWKKKMDCIFNILTVISLANELLAIMYASVASNLLVRVKSDPAASVFALVRRDYELPWVACNVHFMLGLAGFVGMVTSRSLSFFPSTLNLAAAGFGGSAILGMFSIGNFSVNLGDGRGNALGNNLVALVLRYMILLAAHFKRHHSVVGALACVLAAASTMLTIRNLLQPEPLDGP